MDKKCKKCDFRTLDVLLSMPLFRGADEAVLKRSIENGDFSLREYSSGDVIYSPESRERKLIILKDGRASVYSADSSRSLLLRRLVPCRAIGVANLFSSESFVSRVTADKRCETVEIGAESFRMLLEKDPAMMHNYISFLSDKICLLNKKIVCLTAGSAERRLSLFLCEQAEEEASDSFTLPTPMNSLAEMLNLGRASLYRAADRLEADGLILREGKQIRIVNKELLLSKYN